MNECVKQDYETECKRLKDVIYCMENEHNERTARLTNDLIEYEREIEILKAKLSLVELIFKK